MSKTIKLLTTLMLGVCVVLTTSCGPRPHKLTNQHVEKLVVIIPEDYKGGPVIYPAYFNAEKMLMSHAPGHTPKENHFYVTHRLGDAFVTYIFPREFEVVDTIYNLQISRTLCVVGKYKGEWQKYIFIGELEINNKYIVIEDKELLYIDKE